MFKSSFFFVGLLSLLLTACASTPSGPEDRTSPAFTEARRGLHLATLGKSEKAILHFSKSLESLELTDHQRAAILNNRGVAYKNSGRYADAEVDFDAALELKGDLPTRARHNRAVVRFFQGDFLGSAQDFERFITSQEKLNSPYPFLWRYIAQERAGLDGKTRLTKEAGALSLLSWPGSVANYFLTGQDEEALLDEAKVVDPEQSKENLCDAYFFMGEEALLAGKLEKADYWFNKALDTEMVHLNEYKGAISELNRLRGDSHPQDIVNPTVEERRDQPTR